MIGMVLAVVLPHDDLLLIVCQGLERYSWEWWLKGCYIFDPMDTLMAGAAVLTTIGSVKLVSWLSGAR